MKLDVAVEQRLDNLWIEACDKAPPALAALKLNPRCMSARARTADAILLCDKWMLEFQTIAQRLTRDSEIFEAYQFTIRNRRRALLVRSWLLEFAALIP